MASSRSYDLWVALQTRLAQLEPQSCTTQSSQDRDPCAQIYRRKCDVELARIRRVRALQQRGVALLGTAIASLLIGISSFASNLLADRVQD